METNYKRILIRADASSKIGVGHIMRNLVLAKQFPHAKVSFATQALEGNINSTITDARYKLHTLHSNSKKELTKLIKKLKIDLLIIDHYQISFKIEKYIKEKTDITILSFDDTYEKHHCDILLNHNICANALKYKKLIPSHTELRCGHKFTLLRDEFYKEKKKKSIKNKTSNKKLQILLAMGGADTANLNLKILQILQKFENIKINVITTTANKNLAQLKHYCKKQKSVTLHVNSNQIARLMKKSSFAIITPSVTANEAYYMGLPFIAIQTASNQSEMYNYLHKQNFHILKHFTKQKFIKKLNKIIYEQSSFKQRATS